MRIKSIIRNGTGHTIKRNCNDSYMFLLLCPQLPCTAERSKTTILIKCCTEHWEINGRCKTLYKNLCKYLKYLFIK